jgi:hypothetical protein
VEVFPHVLVHQLLQIHTHAIMGYPAGPKGPNDHIGAHPAVGSNIAHWVGDAFVSSIVGYIWAFGQFNGGFGKRVGACPLFIPKHNGIRIFLATGHPA